MVRIEEKKRGDEKLDELYQRILALTDIIINIQKPLESELIGAMNESERRERYRTS